ncbi:MAG: PorT family protein [Saprospiraceae bacterium]|nr:PorT family protein [Saprospiraceae bacterium]MBK9728410.1 PorT family protein [Saprospiraceae bacterium]
MLKYLYFIAFFICSNAAQSQINLIISGGLHSVDVSADDFLITNQSSLDSFKLSFEDASYGYHFGAGIRINFGNFYIQPEVLFNSNKANFKFNDFSIPQLVDSVRTEKYQYLDIPVILGLKFGILRLFAGPVAHIFINNSSELTNISGYKDKFNTASFGYQAGIGFDISFIGIDIRHEGNFSKYGDHINFFGKKYNFDKSASRLIGTLSIKF